MPPDKPKPFRPSNGSQGDAFMADFCERCKREASFDPASGYGGCDIMLRTMAFDIGDPDYPSEWIYGEDGPTCTAFEEVEGGA